MKWLFVALFIFSDPLLESIYSPIAPDKPKPDEPEESYSDFPNDSEAEVYHWNLGTPDNIPVTEVIYDSEPCRY